MGKTWTHTCGAHSNEDLNTGWPPVHGMGAGQSHFGLAKTCYFDRRVGRHEFL